MDDRRISYGWGNFSSIDRSDPPDSDESWHGTSAPTAESVVRKEGPAQGSETAETPSGKKDKTKRNAVKPRSGRRNAKIKDIPNLGAAASQSGRFSGKESSSTVATADASIFDGADEVGDISTDFVTAALNVDHTSTGSSEINAEETTANNDGSATSADFEDEVDRQAASGFASSVLEQGPLLDIAEFDSVSGDNLDLAEFVIQMESPSRDVASGKEEDRATVKTNKDTLKEEPVVERDEDKEEADPDASRPVTQDDDPFADSVADHRYVSPDLRIPIIDEDDIPSIEAAYEYEAAEYRNIEPIDAEPVTAAPTSQPGAPDRETVSAKSRVDREAVAAEERTEEDRDADKTPEKRSDAETETEVTSAAYPTAFVRRVATTPATPDNPDKSDAGYRERRETGGVGGEGARDVDAGRLFSAPSPKRLAIPPHVFEARQRINIISGLAIIGALGFVGWYFSNPGPFERTQPVKASKPKTTEIAGKDGAESIKPPVAVTSVGPREGLIYKPMKKVDLAALTAIGDLEYKITPSRFHKVIRVVKGDTFVSVLVRAGVDAREARRAIQPMRSIYDPRELRIGREIRVAFGVAGAEQTRFMGYHFDSSFDRSIHVARQQSGEFAATEVKKKVRESFSRVDGKITSSLFGDGVRAGAPAQTMVQMINLFSFTVDFQRDLRGGEKFQILFRSHKDASGRVVRNGEIVFASLMVRGRAHRLYLFQNGKNAKPEYLNKKGEGNRKALMKTPIDGAQLTSNFGYRRHPILGYSKLHSGADFGARTGTPIYAAGNGTITKIGWFGNYGKYIRIRHGKVYETAYAHMSRFRPGLKVGSRVTQGETVGYVGSTGRSTGPHLHYEVLKNGKHVNPMTITLPSRKRLQGRSLRRFLAFKKKIDAQYAGMKNEKERREEGRVETVKSESGDNGCKNGIRINPLDKRLCN